MKRIAIIFTVLALSSTSCIKDMICINGNGIIETESRNTSSFNQIENTYLSIFLLLGGLAMILGTVGLGVSLARNIQDRRQEIGILVKH